MSQYLLLIAIAMATCVLGGVMAIVHDRHKERARLARYTLGRSAGEPASIVCPHCARRSYSERAIRERICPSCGKHHDAVAGA